MKTILFIASLFIISAFAATSHENEILRDVWSAWKLKYSKHYAPEEEEKKFNTFCDNYRLINKMNEENPNTKMALNQFADLTQEEWTQKLREGGLESGQEDASKGKHHGISEEL